MKGLLMDWDMLSSRSGGALGGSEQQLIQKQWDAFLTLSQLPDLMLLAPARPQ